MRKVVLYLCMLLACVVMPMLASAEPYALLDTKTYNLINQFSVENTGGAPMTQITAKVYVGASSESLYQQKVRYRITPKQQSLSVDALGNIYAMVSLGTLAPHEKRNVTVEKIIKNSGIAFADEIYQIKADYTDFLSQGNNKQFMQPSKHIESDAPEMVAEAARIDTSKTTALVARDIHLGVNVYLNYTLDETYAHRGALSALKTRQGCCTEFAGLFVAFCRAVGIPARVVSGYWLHRSDPLPLNTPIPLHELRHAWAEFYLPTVGWVPAELTALQYLTTQNYGTQRFSNANSFASIQPDDRHFMWGYGLETEREPNVNVTGYTTSQDGGLKADMVAETVTLMPDDPTPAQP